MFREWDIKKFEQTSTAQYYLWILNKVILINTNIIIMRLRKYKMPRKKWNNNILGENKCAPWKQGK